MENNKETTFIFGVSYLCLCHTDITNYINIMASRAKQEVPDHMTSFMSPLVLPGTISTCSSFLTLGPPPVPISTGIV